MVAAGSDTFQLAMPTDRQIVISRTFKAPRALVFQALTSPEHVPNWWGMRAMKMVLCEMDVRPGGAYRFVLRAPDGAEFGFRGLYKEIVPPERVVSTFEFEGMPGHISEETLTLVEEAGLTRLTVVCLYQSKEDRDGHYHSGMEAGTRETYDRLEVLLESLT
jgi:uncharacterized protein YndB with AHSA1/START domain